MEILNFSSLLREHAWLWAYAVTILDKAFFSDLEQRTSCFRRSFSIALKVD
jgi:hypothetical protein